MWVEDESGFWILDFDKELKEGSNLQLLGR